MSEPEIALARRRRFRRYGLPTCFGLLIAMIFGLTRSSCQSIHITTLERNNAIQIASQTVGMSPSAARAFFAKHPVVGEYSVKEAPNKLTFTSPYLHRYFGKESVVRVTLLVRDGRVAGAAADIEGHN